MNTLNVVSKDGAAIQVYVYKTEEKTPKGIVIVSHGFGEHYGVYVELARHLERAGYACILFDQRGHGVYPDNVKKRFGVIKSYQCFLDDIDAIAAQARNIMPNVPLILYGHSMGGNIVINYLLKVDSRYACAVLESPWLGLSKGPSPLIISLVKLASHVVPDVTIVNKLTVSDISSDPVRSQCYVTDQLYHNRISLRMFTGIDNGCKYALENAARFPVPAFIAYAANERIISNKAILQFIDNAKNIAEVRSYESCHAIHNDKKCEEYFQDVIAFLEKRCPGIGPNT